MGHNTRKSVFGILDNGISKPVCLATETSLKTDISPVASLDIVLSKKIVNKGADQTAYVHALRLCCSQTRKTGFLMSRPIKYEKLTLC